MSLEGTIRAPFSLGEWSGQGFHLGGGGGGILRVQVPVFRVPGPRFLRGLLERESSEPHFQGGPYSLSGYYFKEL